MKTKCNFNGKAMAAALVVIVMMCFSQNTFSQDRWSFEVRPGVNFPTKDLGDVSLNTGFGAEGTLAYRFMPHWSVYAGWSWNKFGSDQKIGSSDLAFEETGYTFGLQFIHPIGESNINLLARAGGTVNHIEAELGGDAISDSGHGFGWQIEGGVVLPLGEKWRLMPSVRYRSLSRDLTIETVTTSVNLNYISAGIGVAKTF